jgi:DNA repair protein SbcD/Mre11
LLRFIHTADIHMGMRFEDASFKGRLSAVRRREIKDTFHRIVKRAGEMRAHLLLIAGDLFEDGYISVGELKEIKAAFSDIPDTRVIIVPGNHDPYIKGSMYELADFGKNVHVVKDPYEKIGFDDLDTDIYALGWDQPYIENDDLIDITIADRSRTNILLAHADIYSRISRYRPLDRAEIQKKGFDYAALGHIHNNEFIAPDVAYPGSPEPLDFGETGLHGIIEGEISKEGTKAVFVPFSSRRFHVLKLRLEPEMTKMDILDTAGKMGDAVNLYRLIFEGSYDRDMDIQEITKELEDYFFYLEILDHAVPELDIERIYEENRGNIIGGFIDEMRKKDTNDPVIIEAFQTGLLQLIQSRGDT